MTTSRRRVVSAAFVFIFALWSIHLPAQSGSNSGTVNGTVADSTGAVIPDAKVSIQNPVSGLNRSTVSDSAGHYQFSNLPFNSYHLAISAAGFNAFATDISIHSSVAVTIANTLTVGTSSTEIEVDGSDLTHNDSGLRTEIDRDAFDKLPSKASPLPSAPSSRSPHPESRLTRTASFTALATTRRTPSPSTASRSPTSRARSSRTNCPPTPSSRSRSSPAPHRPNTAARPASSSRSPRGQGSASLTLLAASAPRMAPSAPRRPRSTSASAARSTATSLSLMA